MEPVALRVLMMGPVGVRTVMGLLSTEVTVVLEWEGCELPSWVGFELGETTTYQ